MKRFPPKLTESEKLTRPTGLVKHPTLEIYRSLDNKHNGREIDIPYEPMKPSDLAKPKV